jgi:hypothetical protein
MRWIQFLRAAFVTRKVDCASPRASFVRVGGHAVLRWLLVAQEQASEFQQLIPRKSSGSAGEIPEV